MNLYPLFKHFAFKMDPEKIHESSLTLFKLAPQLASIFEKPYIDPRYQLNDAHMNWSFPVGLAAGFDKNAQAIDFFNNCGFGAVEVGTVTKEPQTGNPKPRIWRIPQIESVRNAMGFPNAGAQRIKKNIIRSNRKGCLGVNIGKNKETSADDAANEYAYLYDYFADYCDYLVINISSPNTPGLRNLQTKEAFEIICQAVDEKRQKNFKPLYLKISPDLAKEDIIDLVELSKKYKLSGIIATNTTIQHEYGKGGLSGHHLKEIARKARQIVCESCAETKDLSVIGVGGIDTFEEIQDFWRQGGSFVQVYTSFIYHGPQLLKKIQHKLDHSFKEAQVKNLTEYIEYLKKSH